MASTTPGFRSGRWRCKRDFRDETMKSGTLFASAGCGAVAALS
jgi:hypothetical protein